MKRKRISKFGLVVIVLIVYLLTFAIGTLVGNQLQNGTVVSTIQGIIPGGRLNILFMGIDARSDEVNARSDTMILASIDKKTKNAVLVWIPRDTRVEVSPGYFDKINSVNVWQGPEAACRVTGNLMNIDVDYYVLTNFEGFAEIIDILGGVHIDVESNMYHADPDPRLNINLSKGMQLLSGADALRYVRYRGGPTADIGRTERQAKFLKALMEEMIDTSTISKLPELLPKLLENIHTNIPVKEMGTLANVARSFSTDNIITQTLPGYSYTDPNSGASYWKANEELTPGMIDALFAGESFDVMGDPPNWTAPAASTSEQSDELVESEITDPEDPILNEDPEVDVISEDGVDLNIPDEEESTDEDNIETDITGSEGYEPLSSNDSPVEDEPMSEENPGL